MLHYDNQHNHDDGAGVGRDMSGGQLQDPLTCNTVSSIDCKSGAHAHGTPPRLSRLMTKIISSCNDNIYVFK